MKRLMVVVGVLVSVSAGAYVLPGGSILRRMVAGREELPLSSLKVDGSLTFYGAGVREAAAALNAPTERGEVVEDGVLSIRVPHRCRWEASAPDGTRVAVVSSGGRKRVEGTDLPALSAAIEPVCALLALRTTGEVAELREAVDQYLQGLGVQTRTTSLARFGGEVAYVLGDPAEGKPQFWVYKDSFRPARLRWTDKAGTAWDVRFLDFASPVAGEGMPRTIEVWRGGERVMRFTALQADLKARLADTLF
ncbi:hypothetical protein P2318_06970 [Myxococcaceae bacterium GXIMD 01537]